MTMALYGPGFDQGEELHVGSPERETHERENC